MSIRQILITPALMVLVLISLWFGWSKEAYSSDDFLVYGIQNSLDMGNPNEVPVRDIFVTMGAAHGLRPGSILEVMRKEPTYDLINEKLQRDVTFPFATLKIIHVEANTAVARLDKMNPAEQTPSIIPPSVMAGDLVRIKK